MALPSAHNNDQANVKKAAGIFNEYGEFIFSVILYKVQDKTLAEDLYQDFFLSIVSNPVPPDVRNIKSYLYKSLKNDVIDAGRRTERYRNMKSGYAEYTGCVINKKSSRNAFNNEERTDEIFELIGGNLTPSEARAITLRYKKDRSIGEIAKEMNVKKESVSRYICVGLTKLRRLLNVK
ncbi:MAG: RNA polymerase sigma factor [Planctomycetota bacterium]|jgi:RNA polymerase sigma factor (sigma-70 family)